MRSEKISACVMTMNEERNIRRCLESLTWCDEIVVLDSGSTDRTVEICREFTEQVHYHEWLGYVGQRNMLSKMANFEWVLFLDADEEVSHELKGEIIGLFESGDGEVYVGARFPRRVYYLDRWIKHGEWNPDVKLRLYKKEHGVIAGQEPHDQVMVDGPVKKLRGKLYHYTYEGLQDHINTMDRYSTISASTMYKRGRKFRLTDILIRPPFRFFKGFVIKLGFLDGIRGFIIASVNAFGVFLKYSKLRELEWADNRAEREGRTDVAGPGTSVEAVAPTAASAADAS